VDLAKLYYLGHSENFDDDDDDELSSLSDKTGIANLILSV